MQQLEQHTHCQPPRQGRRCVERTRNRHSERLIETFTPPPQLDPKWSSVGCVIRVERTGKRGNVPYQSISYYLCSLAPNSQPLAMGIRQHWQIENRLHWVKDVVLQEDSSPQRAGLSAINLSLLKTWVLSLFRIHGYDSLTEAISSSSHNIKYLLSLCC